MPAINGVKKSSVVKKQSSKHGKGVVAISIIVTLLLTVLSVALFWKFYYEDTARDQFLMESQQGQRQVYKATRDITSGEYVDGAVELVAVPSYLIVTNSLNSGESLSQLKASGNIAANSIITVNNTYDPEMQDPILSTSRIVQIGYIETPGIEVGDFIDVRLKVSVGNKLETFRDDIVCSKKEVLSKDEAGNIQLMLSESEILNLNSAVIEAANQEQQAMIHVAKYLDPANQPKAIVNYDGKGIKYAEKELLEAQDVLRKNQNDKDSSTEITEPNENAEVNNNTEVTDNTDGGVTTGSEVNSDVEEGVTE